MATILIIEDDRNMAELIKERLEEKGYETIIAYTGIKGLQVTESQNPDAITLDIHLPDISGIDVLKSLKKSNTSPPVIVVTSDDTVEQKCKEYKADGFIKKPINFKKLEELIEVVLKNIKK